MALLSESSMKRTSFEGYRRTLKKPIRQTHLTSSCIKNRRNAIEDN